MEKVLKQNEIDALFEAARSSIPEKTRNEVRSHVVSYNFSTAGQISNEQIPAQIDRVFFRGHKTVRLAALSLSGESRVGRTDSF